MEKILAAEDEAAAVQVRAGHWNQAPWAEGVTLLPARFAYHSIEFLR